tara:strand:+ start:408 stop:665 length:258 start_codon:yes stop_codon:yes gene_type:complete
MIISNNPQKVQKSMEYRTEICLLRFKWLYKYQNTSVEIKRTPVMIRRLVLYPFNLDFLTKTAVGNAIGTLAITPDITVFVRLFDK